MSRIFARIVAVALMSAVVAAGAGTMCLLPASAAPLHTGCHPARVPANPHPADYRCCVGRHPAALTTSVFSPQPAVEAVAGATHPLVVTTDGDLSTTSFAPSGGPPGSLILRI